MTEMSTTQSTSSREIALERALSATPDVVFRAWVEPTSVIQWWGPRGWMTPSWASRIEVVVGGAWRLVSISTADQRERWNGGRYLEIDEPRRLVFTCGDATEPGTIVGETLVTVELAALPPTDQGPATRIVLRQSGFGSDDEMRAAEGAWGSSLDCLADYLSGA